MKVCKLQMSDFFSKVSTNNLSKKFSADPVNRWRDEQMEEDGNKTPVRLHWQSSKHFNMCRSLPSTISHKDHRHISETNWLNINFTSLCGWQINKRLKGWFVFVSALVLFFSCAGWDEMLPFFKTSAADSAFKPDVFFKTWKDPWHLGLNEQVLN